MSATATQADLKFANKVHTKLGKSTENLFYSPFSILSAMGMCAAGAKGKTQDALIKLLELPTNVGERDDYLQSLTEEVNQDGRPYELVTANALWPQAGLNLDENYVEKVQNVFGGAIQPLDYFNNPEQAVETVNAWADENTRGKIPTVVSRDSVDSDTRLILTNAIYFLGKWAVQFKKEKTKDENFQAGAKTVKVPTMHGKGEYQYGETPEFQALDLPYEGDNLSMLVVLPSLIGTEGLDADLEATYTNAVESLQHEENVVVSLPKFKLETDYKLGSTFKQLGAGIAFSDQADFSGITKDEMIQISEVIHKGFVRCDEEGTEAAAVTAVVMRACSFRPSQEKIFKADRPFLFFIRNNETGTVLFCGRVANPV